MGITSKHPWLFQCSLLFFFLCLNAHFSVGSDTISSGQSLSGNQSIISVGGVFELGFFKPGKSQNYYIGIWYKKLPYHTVVWVANRDQAVSNAGSSSLKLLQDGNLVLLNKTNSKIWSTSTTSNKPNSTVAILLDNGNFVIRDKSDMTNVIWQSFDNPTDTWLPGGKLGYNKLTNQKQILTSWRNSENPATSPFSVRVKPNGTSHVLMWNESEVYWTSGEWTGKIFTLVPEIQEDYYVKNFTYISNENESYFTYSAAVPSAFTRFVLDVTGQLKQFVWSKDFNRWALFWTRPTQQCEVYAYCGAFSSCNQQKTPLCNCLEGFEPSKPEDWKLEDYSSGCVRKAPLQCHNQEVTFQVLPNINFPVNSESISVDSMEECRSACMADCSCMGFAYESGCLIWKGDLLNLQQLPSGKNIGKEFNLRLSESFLGVSKGKAKKKTKSPWIVTGVIAGFFTFSVIILVIIRRRRSGGAFEAIEGPLVVFKYRELRGATKNFSDKVGEGGFGSVFRGTLSDSTAIAVKLIKNLKQGEKQFRAEVRTIGAIQHINLARLRGFCVEGSKRFLVYDYMENGSLESHLFKNNNSNTLDWKYRYEIAIGTARGLAYLHEKCRECIIHFDIKPENILLDAEYIPKVSDFGLAKLLGRDFSRVLTTTRGTRGYMAPEWLSGETVTPKADVFSYGMLLFEVISGKRNNKLFDNGTDEYFPSRVAYTLIKGEDVLPLLDYRLEGKVDKEELSRACKIACWCIQDSEKNRPTMGLVVQILAGVSEIGIPPVPQFIQNLAESPVKAYVLEDTSSSSYL